MLYINFSLTFALEYGEGIEGEGFHLILAREAVDGSQELHTLTEAADNIL